jgi:hypothetical protein
MDDAIILKHNKMITTDGVKATLHLTVKSLQTSHKTCSSTEMIDEVLVVTIGANGKHL